MILMTICNIAILLGFIFLAGGIGGKVSFRFGPAGVVITGSLGTVLILAGIFIGC